METRERNGPSYRQKLRRERKRRREEEERKRKLEWNGWEKKSQDQTRMCKRQQEAWQVTGISLLRFVSFFRDTGWSVSSSFRPFDHHKNVGAKQRKPNIAALLEYAHYSSFRRGRYRLPVYESSFVIWICGQRTRAYVMFVSSLSLVPCQTGERCSISSRGAYMNPCDDRKLRKANPGENERG